MENIRSATNITSCTLVSLFSYFSNDRYWERRYSIKYNLCLRCQCVDFSELQSPKESSGEMRASETQIEIEQTETMTKQLSSTWTGDGQRNLEKRLSHTFPGIGFWIFWFIDGFPNNLKPKEESSFLQSQCGVQMDSMTFREFSPMLRNPSSFLGEIPVNLSFNRNPSSNLVSMGIPLYQRNPSFEGNYISDLAQYSVPVDIGLLQATQGVAQEGHFSESWEFEEIVTNRDRWWRSAGERQVVFENSNEM